MKELDKFCHTCGNYKLLTEFYPHKRDGYQSMCKECKREASRIYNLTPKRKEYNKQFSERLKESGYFREYYQRPEVKKRQAERQRQYAPDPTLRSRYIARWYAKRMTNNGTIKQLPCAFCGNEESQRHHPDYSQPLLIVWLCATCHRELHIKSKGGG